MPVEEVLLQLQWLVLPVLALALTLKSKGTLLSLAQGLAQVELQVRPLAPALVLQRRDRGGEPHAGC